jgi:hypothetical protein
MACAAFVGCASEKKVTLVNDPDAHGESQMPWNKQEKWESTSQYAGVTDHR